MNTPLRSCLEEPRTDKHEERDYSCQCINWIFRFYPLGLEKEKKGNDQNDENLPQNVQIDPKMHILKNPNFQRPIHILI